MALTELFSLAANSFIKTRQCSINKNPIKILAKNCSLILLSHISGHICNHKEGNYTGSIKDLLPVVTDMILTRDLYNIMNFTTLRLLYSANCSFILRKRTKNGFKKSYWCKRVWKHNTREVCPIFKTNKQANNLLSLFPCMQHEKSEPGCSVEKRGSMFISEEIPQLKPFVWP